MTTTYTTRDGDTFDGIAQKFGISLQSLESVNPDVTEPDVGRVLNIP